MLWNPYIFANAALLFNNLELNEIPVTSGTGKGDPLSSITFILSALPALIKVQTLSTYTFTFIYLVLSLTMILFLMIPPLSVMIILVICIAMIPFPL